MRDLLITKCPIKDCSIVNKILRRFIVNCYTIVLSNENAMIETVLIFFLHFLFY
jgi:hypothetical protein